MTFNSITVGLMLIMSATCLADEPLAHTSVNTRSTLTVWCHNKNKFAATTGENINVDFQFQSSEIHGTFMVALSPVWLNIHNDSFTGTESVKAVFFAYNYSSRDTAPRRSSDKEIELELRWDSHQRKFTASPDTMFMVSSRGNGSDVTYYTSYELSILIDGRWLSFGPNADHSLLLNPNVASEVVCDDSVR